MSVNLGGLTIMGRVVGNIPQTGYRYFRLYVNTFAGDSVRVEAINIMVGPTVYPTSPMTSSNTPPPLVVAASSFYLSFFPYRAFSNLAGQNNSIRWVSNLNVSSPQWISLDLGIGNTITPTALRICTDNDAATNYMTSFVFQGSNTGSFSGEQVALYTSGILTSSNWTASSFTTFTF